jgi:hypothetical protein
MARISAFGRTDIKGRADIPGPMGCGPCARVRMTDKREADVCKRRDLEGMVGAYELDKCYHEFLPEYSESNNRSAAVLHS